MLEYLNDHHNSCDIDALTQAIQKNEKLLESKGSIPFKEDITNLPKTSSTMMDLSGDKIRIGNPQDLDEDQLEKLTNAIHTMIPWRKGPFDFFGIDLDAEWRSDLKWKRIENHLDNLDGKTVLDIGCNNGYYMFKMAKNNPALVLGIDPVLRCRYQFDLVQSYTNLSNLKFEMLGIEHVHLFDEMFDLIFNMGIIYHHKNPIAQLEDCIRALKPGGQMILETIGIPGDSEMALFPSGRYASMKNIWFIPTLPCLINWMSKVKFIDIKIISDTLLTAQEQRVTKWCPHKSLHDFLDPSDPSKTIEGHPAPRRFAISVRKKI